MEDMYAAEEARLQEENRTRLVSYLGVSEEREQESQRESDDWLGLHDTVSSDVRAWEMAWKKGGITPCRSITPP